MSETARKFQSEIRTLTKRLAALRDVTYVVREDSNIRQALQEELDGVWERYRAAYTEELVGPDPL